MASIRIEQEIETARGWQFHAVITGEDGLSATRHVLRMSWADYDYWSHGSAPPVKVAEAVLRFLLDRGETPEAEFDAATVRRRRRELDEELGRYL